ncbi:MAG: hypothetical protein PCFJNLEI_03787 [Verrucomicrobiae bacterium]|nr:hypothetical protein [Verrucomicrobiae bacterium]
MPRSPLSAILSVMRKKREIRWGNKNHTDWWVFEEVQQWVSKRQKKLSPSTRCLVYINLRVVRAKSREKAYRKAVEFGRAGMPSKTNGGEWRFAGISMLLPIYDKIEDGSEILWDKKKMMTVARIKKLVKSKRRLPVFDDREEKA